MRIRHSWVIVSLTLIAIGPLFMTSAQSSNCGGNSAALHVCRAFPLYLLVRMDQIKSARGVNPTPNQLTADLTWKQLARLFDSMSQCAEYSVMNPDEEFPAGRHVVVIICDTEFDNVPQPSLWNLFRRTPAHAVGYADGSSGLISPAQYQGLNRGGFISVKEWIRLRRLSQAVGGGGKRANARGQE